MKQNSNYINGRLVLNAEEENELDIPSPEPDTKPEVEPEKMPKEDPGIQPGTQPGKSDDDDDDDNPFTETEIGDDPDEIQKKTTIM